MEKQCICGNKLASNMTVLNGLRARFSYHSEVISALAAHPDHQWIFATGNQPNGVGSEKVYVLGQEISWLYECEVCIASYHHNGVWNSDSGVHAVFCGEPDRVHPQNLSFEEFTYLLSSWECLRLEMGSYTWAPTHPVGLVQTVYASHARDMAEDLVSLKGGTRPFPLYSAGPIPRHSDEMLMDNRTYRDHIFTLRDVAPYNGDPDWAFMSRSDYDQTDGVGYTAILPLEGRNLVRITRMVHSLLLLNHAISVALYSWHTLASWDGRSIKRLNLSPEEWATNLSTLCGTQLMRQNGVIPDPSCPGDVAFGKLFRNDLRMRLEGMIIHSTSIQWQGTDGADWNGHVTDVPCSVHEANKGVYRGEFDRNVVMSTLMRPEAADSYIESEHYYDEDTYGNPRGECINPSCSEHGGGEDE